MTAIRIALGVIGMLMIIVSLVFALRSQIYPPPYSATPFEVALDAGQVAAELDRLAGLADEGSGATLGRLAAAAQGCIAGSLGTGLPDKVMQGGRRMFIVYYAMRNGIESPLIDPRTRDISLDGPPGPEALVARWEEEGQSGATIERWRWYMDTYFDAGNPIYAGLGIQPNTFDAQDLGKVFGAVDVTGKDFAPCVASRAG